MSKFGCFAVRDDPPLGVSEDANADEEHDYF